jgi:peptidoglycan hydrolase-like protein with peptidoglycan-binding domain
MMNTTKWFAGACLLVLAGVTSVGAQEQMVPVMRIGNWIQVGGGLPVAWVLQAQERLKAAGFEPGPLDGTLGPQTRDALRRYQKTYQLPATGELDAATLKALGIQ